MNTAKYVVRSNADLAWWINENVERRAYDPYGTMISEQKFAALVKKYAGARIPTSFAILFAAQDMAKTPHN